MVTEVEKELERNCDSASAPPPLPLTPAPSAPSLQSRSKAAYPPPSDRPEAFQDSRIAASKAHILWLLSPEGFVLFCVGGEAYLHAKYSSGNSNRNRGQVIL